MQHHKNSCLLICLNLRPTYEIPISEGSRGSLQPLDFSYRVLFSPLPWSKVKL